MGVRIFICEMSMDLTGLKREEMIQYKDLAYCGEAKFLEEARVVEKWKTEKTGPVQLVLSSLILL